MWRTNLKVGLTVVGTLALYTVVANVIPQVRSEVPQRLEIGDEVTVERLVELGERVYHGVGGCEACHGLGTRAPELLDRIGTVCAERVTGQDCESYLYRSLVEPGAHVVEGFQPIMPPMDRQLSNDELWALVAFLQSQGGEVTVDPERLASGEGDASEGAAGSGVAAASAAGESGPDPAAASTPTAILAAYGCTACHALEGEGAPVGPAVEEIRASGHPADYLRRAILDPTADTAAGYGAMAGTMPPNFGVRMTAAQLETLVRFLADRGEEEGS